MQPPGLVPDLLNQSFCEWTQKSIFLTGYIGNYAVFGELHFVHKPQLMDLRKPNTSLLILAWTLP